MILLLVDQFDLTRPTIPTLLKVLQGAGLIIRIQTARARASWPATSDLHVAAAQTWTTTRTLAWYK
ncbi:hypothetical protein [Yoonia sp. SDW83-1]|uniref:hypothetical protein n=1 Tax=Yoonia sp. SDW83-1 TaxID=3366945 RepID=UPI00398C5168